MPFNIPGVLTPQKESAFKGSASSSTIQVMKLRAI
jgi:hypothetical protein